MQVFQNSHRKGRHRDIHSHRRRMIPQSSPVRRKLMMSAPLSVDLPRVRQRYTNADLYNAVDDVHQCSEPERTTACVVESGTPSGRRYYSEATLVADSDGCEGFHQSTPPPRATHTAPPQQDPIVSHSSSILPVPSLTGLCSDRASPPLRIPRRTSSSPCRPPTTRPSAADIARKMAQMPPSAQMSSRGSVDNLLGEPYASSGGATPVALEQRTGFPGVHVSSPPPRATRTNTDTHREVAAATHEQGALVSAPYAAETGVHAAQPAAMEVATLTTPVWVTAGFDAIEPPSASGDDVALATCARGSAGSTRSLSPIAHFSFPGTTASCAPNYAATVGDVNAASAVSYRVEGAKRALPETESEPRSAVFHPDSPSAAAKSVSASVSPDAERRVIPSSVTPDLHVCERSTSLLKVFADAMMQTEGTTQISPPATCSERIDDATTATVQVHRPDAVTPPSPHEVLPHGEDDEAFVSFGSDDFNAVDEKLKSTATLTGLAPNFGLPILVATASQSTGSLSSPPPLLSVAIHQAKRAAVRTPLNRNRCLQTEDVRFYCSSIQTPPRPLHPPISSYNNHSGSHASNEDHRAAVAPPILCSAWTETRTSTFVNITL